MRKIKSSKEAKGRTKGIRYEKTNSDFNVIYMTFEPKKKTTSKYTELIHHNDNEPEAKERVEAREGWASREKGVTERDPEATKKSMKRRKCGRSYRILPWDLQERDQGRVAERLPTATRGDRSTPSEARVRLH